jgi:hypothetical protein
MRRGALLQEPESIGGIQFADVDKNELLAAIRTDCVTFFAFYLGDDLTLEVPDLHEDVWDELLHYVEQVNQRQVNLILQKLFAIPRGFAKSTIAKLAAILFLKYTYFKFCLYVSKTNGHAKNAIRDIMIWLTSENEKRLFGPSIIEKSSETESLWIMQITIRLTPTSAPYMKRVIFKALGADQQVRGLNILNMRPQIVIVDDIEDNDNTTIELQPKLDVWFMGALMKAFASEAFVLFIGNMIRETTLLARLSKDAEWHPTVYGSIVKRNGLLSSLWEAKFPYKNLIAEYTRYRKMGLGNVWEAEMMNLTQDQILAKDLKNVVRPTAPLPEELTSGCLILDPAFGKTASSDEAAITVHARMRGLTIPVVIDSWHGKGDHDVLLDEMIRLSYYWGITTWFVEADAAQKLYKPLFELLLTERKIPEGIFMIVPIGSGGVAKSSRITGFRSVVSTGSYGVADSQQEVIDRLAAYDPMITKHDDLEDSASYGAIVWAMYNVVIESKGMHQVAMLIANATGRTKSLNRIESQVTSF